MESSSAEKGQTRVSSVPGQQRQAAASHAMLIGLQLVDEEEELFPLASYPQKRDCAVTLGFSRPNWINLFGLLQHITILKLAIFRI